MNEHVFIFCTHGRFGDELIKSAELIVGPLVDVKAVSLLEGVSPVDYREQVESKIKEAEGKKVIALVDIFGGTPCTTLVGLSQDYDLEVVTGVNLAMVLEMVSQRSQLSTKDLIECGLNALKESGRDVMSMMKGV